MKDWPINPAILRELGFLTRQAESRPVVAWYSVRLGTATTSRGNQRNSRDPARTSA
jgi:hypothetical protein